MSGASQKLLTHHDANSQFSNMQSQQQSSALLNGRADQNIILSSLQHSHSQSQQQHHGLNLMSQSQNGFNTTNAPNGSNPNATGNIQSDHGQNNLILEKPNYIALFDYESATKDDMTIKKNDQLIVMDKSHADWWLARNLRTKDTGYVPFNYITSIDDLQIKEWFFPNTSRREAERLLEYLDNEPGVFLIRESEQDNGKLVSVHFGL
jgi:hypothetical protein